MKGIITRTLEVKAVFDNMAEDMRPVFFKVEHDGNNLYWSMAGYNRMRVELDDRGDWFILYGEDPENRCELEFWEDRKTGKMIPYEYTVWNHWKQRTYHKVFIEF